MGQRLVITITMDSEPVAAIYYHWSAYTVAALEEVKRIIDTFGSKDWDSDEDMQLDLIHFCEKIGGGIYDEQELNYVKKMFPNETFKTDNINRNDGIIAISQNGISELQSYSEGDVELDFDDDGTVENSVCCWYESLDDINRDRMDADYDPLTSQDIKQLDISIVDFGFNDIDKVLKQLEGNFTYCKCWDGYYEISR